MSPRVGVAPPNRDKLLCEVFAAIDTDGDGSISMADLQTHVKSEIMVKFMQHVDSTMGNGDGLVQINEWLAGSEPLRMRARDKVSHRHAFRSFGCALLDSRHSEQAWHADERRGF